MSNTTSATAGSTDYISLNKALWNARAEAHRDSEFYDVPGFLAGRSSLNPPELDLLGDIKGKSLLHLQCHFGQDTLSLARIGAKCTGMDFSEEAIRVAQDLNSQTGLDAKFVCSNVYDLNLDEQFDIVFTSYGVLGWLPDLEAWAAVVAKHLKPGGRFVIVELHPFVWMFDSAFSKIEYSYFNEQAIVEEAHGSYADRSAHGPMPEIGWNHSLSEIAGSLLRHGLQINRLEEYDYSPYNIFPDMTERAPGEWVLAANPGKLPLLYGIVATRTV